jgi:hypothetical protein
LPLPSASQPELLLVDVGVDSQQPPPPQTPPSQHELVLLDWASEVALALSSPKSVCGKVVLFLKRYTKVLQGAFPAQIEIELK